MIAVNGRFLRQPTTGVQRYAKGILGELLKMRDDLVVLAPKGKIDWAESVPIGQVIQFGAHEGHVWEQCILPAKLRRIGSPFLLSLGNTAPISYRNQVTTHHDISYVRHPEAYTRSFRAAYGLLVPMFLRRSRRVLTSSQFSRLEISRHFKLDLDKIAVVPGAASDIFSPASRSSVTAGEPYILAVSSMSAHKNFERLIAAYELFLEETADPVQMIVVGGGGRAFGRMKSGDSPQKVQFLGRVSDATLVELYRGATAFVFPSLYEGFGIPPLEAQKCGCVVLASRAASIPEVLAESVLYFDPYSVRSIARAITSAVSDGRLRDSLREKGFLNVDRFSWSISARKVSEILDLETGRD